MTTLAEPVHANPFVGPRAFRRGEALYGRDDEVLNLVDLVMAERVVLVYSPSGAGKTSLIQAALVERLEAEGFLVPPVIRLNAAPTDDGSGPAANRYVASALACIDGAFPPERQRSGPDLAAYTFRSYLDEAFPPDDGHVLLVFDQFEEMLTLDPTDLDAKHEFCRQVGEALSDRRRWAIFALREDFVAALDPYLRHFPARVSCRFRLDLMGPRAAREALVRTAEAGGTTFAGDAAVRLVDDLRQIMVDRGGVTTHELGPYVEPVQLQVAGRRLWDSLPDGKRAITESDVAGIGNLTDALGDFYDEQLDAVAPNDEEQRTVRDWFDRELVTDQGFRSQTLNGPRGEPASSSALARRLEDAHLLRSESRRGTTWFELAHDRLVEPVRKSNAAWRRAHLDPVEQQALLWEASGRPDRLLLAGAPLERAKGWIAARGPGGHPAVREFVDRSEAERKGQAAGRYRRWLVVGAVVTVLAVVATSVAVALARSSSRQASRARTYELIGQSQALEERDPSLSILLALEAMRDAPGSAELDARSALYRALNAERPPADALGSGRLTGLESVAFSPDGRSIAAGAAEGDVILWDAQTGAEPRRLTEHTQRVGDLAFSPDGTRLATASDDGSALVVNLANGQVVVALEGHTGAVNGVAFSPDGQRVATVGADGATYMWDTATRERVPFGEVQPGPLNDVAFSPDGARLARATDEGSVLVNDVATTAQVAVITGHDDPVNEVAFSPDGQRIVTAGLDGLSRLADAATGGDGLPLDADSLWVDSAAFSPDGSSIITTTDNGEVVVWSAVDGTELRRIPTTNSITTVAAFSPDGSEVVTAGDSQVAALHDLATGVTRTVLPTEAVDELAASPDGRHVALLGRRDEVFSTSADGLDRMLLAREATSSDSTQLTDIAIGPGDTPYVSGGADGTVRLWDRATATERAVVDVDEGSAVTAVDVSPDGDFAVAATEGGVLAELPVPDGKEAERLLDGGPTIDDAVIVDSTTIAVLAQGAVRLFDRGGDQPERLPTERPATRIARIGGAEPGLVIVTEDGAVHTWVGGSAGIQAAPPRADVAPVADLAVSTDGRTVALVTEGRAGDGGWQPPVVETAPVVGGSFTPVAAAETDDFSTCPPQNPVQVAFLPAGSLAVASASGEVTVCDVVADRTLDSSTTVSAVEFAPRGDRVASGGDDATTVIWDVGPRGPEPNPPSNQHSDWVNDVAWSPDGDRLATASDDGTAVISSVDGASLATELTLRGHSDWVLGVDWSPDGSLVATASQDATAVVWDSQSGDRLVTLKHDLPVNDVAFSPDGASVATASDDGKVRLWDVDTGEEQVLSAGTEARHEHMVFRVEFTADGRRLISTGADGTAILWDVEKAKSVRVLAHHSGYVTGLAVHPDEPLVATASDDGTVLVTVTDPASEPGTVDTRIELPTTPVAVSFSPDGAAIAISDSAGRVLIDPLGDEALEDVAEQRAGRALRPGECERFLHHDC